MNNLPQIIEQNNQRVLTTAQLAKEYGTDNKHINDNFTNNKDRYILGKHYFALEGNTLREFKEAYPILSGDLKYAPYTYLWTEKGAWLHAKSLNTDRAWEAYETLVDEYYCIKEAKTIQLTSIEALLQAVQILQKQEQEIKQLQQTQTVLNHRIDSLDAINTEGDHRQRLNRMIQKYAMAKGVLFAAAWRDFKNAYNLSFHTNLELLIQNLEKKTGLKNVTIPQYLAVSNKLEDGIRVADKLLAS